MNNQEIMCLECGSCVGSCPMQINIPEYLKIYKDYLSGDEKTEKDWKSVDSKGNPMSCIGCARCMDMCPQEIEIPNHISRLAKVIRESQFG